MSKSIPSVRKYMTTCPLSVAPEQHLADASRLMKENHIRHLPVLDQDALVGLISDRDINLIETMKGVDPTKITVEMAMSQEVFTVSPDDLLDEVAATMASRKYGSAVVMSNEKVVGMFTTVDALTALSELLRTRLASA